MAEFCGTWQIDNSSGFDDYMKAIGRHFFLFFLIFTASIDNKRYKFGIYTSICHENYGL